MGSCALSWGPRCRAPRTSSARRVAHYVASTAAAGQRHRQHHRQNPFYRPPPSVAGKSPSRERSPCDNPRRTAERPTGHVAGGDGYARDAGFDSGRLAVPASHLHDTGNVFPGSPPPGLPNLDDYAIALADHTDEIRQPTGTSTPAEARGTSTYTPIVLRDTNTLTVRQRLDASH